MQWLCNLQLDMSEYFARPSLNAQLWSENWCWSSYCSAYRSVYTEATNHAIAAFKQIWNEIYQRTFLLANVENNSYCRYRLGESNIEQCIYFRQIINDNSH